jgi:hypothetical protein
MITCPACRHAELEGELFCSECGARLGPAWNDPAATLAVPHAPGRDGPPPDLDALVRLRPGQIALTVAGAAAPVVLDGRAEYVLGREGSDQVAADVNLSPYGGREKGVSRAHAVLRRERSQWLLIDLGSTNGTRVNGAPAPAHQPVLVHNGDEIRLSRLVIKVNFLP